MNKSSSVLPIILVVILVLCCCVIAILGGGYYVLKNAPVYLPSLVSDLPIQTGGDVTPTPFDITRVPVDEIPTDTLELLNRITIPGRDYADLACRLNAVCNVPETLPPPAVPYQVGDEETFWVHNEDTASYFERTATLRYATPHVYFWIENGINYDEQDLADLAETFETEIYPTNREFFGSEWTPGIDGDPHIYIIYTSGLGSNVAGYFYSPDEYNPLIRENSNAHEAFYIASSQWLSDDYTYGALAHEFQHMIHWSQDINEGSFLNEGFSELATFLNGYDTGGFDWFYLMSPDINLTDWTGSTGDNSAHYGANFIFVTYFLDRFGEEATQALVHNPQNDLESVDTTLAELGITDPATGALVTADDFFLDWTIANYLQDNSVGDGRYNYDIYPNAYSAYDTEMISTCPQDRISRTVNQYGVDYIRITCSGDYTIHFEGATTVKLVPADPHSGSYFFWSNKGHESIMSLSRQFDLTGVTGPVEMTYWTWYDIELDYDYIYVETSTDGENWQIFPTPSSTDYDPNGSSYGWGYTGPSGGWIEETLDLSQFAGGQLWVRFDYITDLAVNGEGFLLDDVSIPAIGYAADFETDDGGWQANGFVRVENVLPQNYRLALITHAAGGDSVEIIPPSADQSFDISLNIGQNGIQDVVLVVTATTRYTRALAPYQIEIK